MTDKDVLTQDEIDALLTGAEESETEDAGEEGAREIVEYDLTRQDRVVRGRMPTVERICERFTRQIRSSLPSCLRIPLEVGSGGVQIVKFSEYAETLYVPTGIQVLKIKPFAGACLLCLDAKLIHRIVDRFFGGDGESDSFDGREFSMTEQKVINRIVDLLTQELEAAWEEVLPISCEVIGSEVNPGLLNVVPQSDAVLVTSYRIDLEDRGGELHIVFPYTSLEPYKRVLDATSGQDDDSRDQEWRAALEQSVLDAQLPMSCVIGETSLRLRDLIKMRPGDVLDIHMEPEHLVTVDKVPVFSATLGDSRGKFALEFESFGKGV